MKFSFDKSNHRYYLDGRRIPNITRVIAPCQPTQFYTESARDRGSEIHKLIEKVCNQNGREIVFDSKYAGYVDAWHKFQSDHGYKSIISELPMYHKQLHYAGTPDQYGRFNGKDYGVFEIKTGADHPSYALQTAAQSEMIISNNHKRPTLRFTLQLFNAGQYKIHMHKGHNDFQIFKSLLIIHQWRSRHNIEIARPES